MHWDQNVTQRTHPSSTATTQARPRRKASSEAAAEAPRAAARNGSANGLPTFLIIGAQKCGTTSLHRYLSAHPQVFMSKTKELDFFVEEKMLGRGLDWYRSHFAGADDTVAIGEASPSYTCFPHFGG